MSGSPCCWSSRWASASASAARCDSPDRIRLRGRGCHRRIPRCCSMTPSPTGARPALHSQGVGVVLSQDGGWRRRGPSPALAAGLPERCRRSGTVTPKSEGAEVGGVEFGEPLERKVPSRRGLRSGSELLGRALLEGRRRWWRLTPSRGRSGRGLLHLEGCRPRTASRRREACIVVVDAEGHGDRAALVVEVGDARSQRRVALVADDAVLRQAVAA